MADKRFVISIGRECGSGGHEIGEKLAEHYGIKLYDKNILDLLAEETGKDPGELAKLEESISGWLPTRKGGFQEKTKDLMNRLSDSDRMYLYERAIIQRLAAQESIVISGYFSSIISHSARYPAAYLFSVIPVLSLPSQALHTGAGSTLKSCRYISMPPSSRTAVILP